MQNSECINNPRPQQNYADAKDSELLQFMADGVDAAFDVFSARYLQALNRLVYRLGFSGAESEDMLQDILVHIWQKAHLWTRQEGITARAWIYRVATNLCIDVQRKNKRQPVQNAVDIDMTHAGEDAARTDAQARRPHPRRHSNDRSASSASHGTERPRPCRPPECCSRPDTRRRRPSNRYRH